MSDRHKRPPIPVRLPAGDESWLKEHARHTGQAVNAIVRRAIADYRERNEKEDKP
jgi:hypothetical protein